jgi:hypothetical protein
MLTLHQSRSRPFAAENATPEYEYRSTTKVVPALSFASIKALPSFQRSQSSPCHFLRQF